MALDSTIELVGALGNRLAQQHYASTSDLDGPLPWLPTDADRAQLVQELGRPATLEEEGYFEAGYRESMLRLDGNSHSPLLSGPMWHEIKTSFARYGFSWPAEGTEEHRKAYLLVLQMLKRLKEDLGRLAAPNQNVGAKTTEGAEGEVGT